MAKQGEACGPVIGLFMSRLDRAFHRASFLSVAQAAHDQSARCICFDGGVLCSPGDPDAPANVLYNLVDPHILDGLVVWSSCIDWSVTPSAMEEFCGRYASLPIVSVGRAPRGIPAVLVDNYHGMRASVGHLVREHGHRRIAFLRGPAGNDEEELRFQAYLDALGESGIPYDPQLVSAHTNWERQDGGVMLRLLQERGLRPGTDFAAIVSVGDEMACGAIEYLQSQGIRVPEDVAVIGFNDDEEGRALMPSLTSVRQPVELLGQVAVAQLLGLLGGRPVPPRTVLPLELIVRRSCGCLSPAVLEAGSESPASMPDWGRATRGTPPDRLTSGMPAGSSITVRDCPTASVQDGLSGERVEALAAVLGPAAGPEARQWVGQLIDAFWKEMAAPASAGLGSTGALRKGALPKRALPKRSFLSTFDGILRQAIASGGEIGAWHGVISAFRRDTLPALAGPDERQRAEDLWQQARVLIAETWAQAWHYQHFQAELHSRRVNEAGQAMATAAGLEAMLDVLAERLPGLGVRRCYLARYRDPAFPAGDAELLLAYEPSGRVSLEDGSRVFPASELLPSSLRGRALYHNLVMLPLYFKQRQLGFLLVEMDATALAVAETLREDVSGALEGVLLRADLERAWHEAESANFLKSRFLATVSHELRTPLSLIVGTIEMMLRAEEFEGPRDASLSRDLASVHASAQHLADLIGDVLDLASSQAGELRLVRRELDLREVLLEVNRLGEPLARGKGLGWRADVPPSLPPVWGDRARLRQVVVNLVSNAIKFTNRGEIGLRAEAEEEAITVLVSDTGVGIAADEQAAIFDEFRQAERTAQRGYGGAGLGLAISRRLVEMHGGKIGVRSSGEDGSGSTFFFTLPALRCPGRTVEPERDRRDKVLLLTGRQGSSGALAAQLEQRGFKVEELALPEPQPTMGQAENLCVAEVIARAPGAVVLDFEPAGEQGWALMRALREDPATEGVPVIFYTWAEEQERGGVLQLDYLSKPLALAELARALERQGVEPSSPGETKTVLIVDDDPAMLEMHARLIETRLAGWQVWRANDGRAALTMMENRRPTLVLLDLMMPVLDGFGVLEAMRAREATRDIPVLILTAQIVSQADMSRLQQGVAAILDKGMFGSEEVLAQIDQILTRSKRLSHSAQRVVRQAMAFIHEHYGEDISRENLAHHVGVSERYLTRCFSEETGLTLINYLTRYRIKQARALLDLGTMNITEVAVATGFCDSNYFSKVFRQEVGLSPREYIRQRQP